MDEAPTALIAIAYLLFVTSVVYVSYPFFQAFISHIQGTARILAIAGSFVLLLIILVVFPALLMMETREPQ